MRRCLDKGLPLLMSIHRSCFATELLVREALDTLNSFPLALLPSLLVYRY